MSKTGKVLLGVLVILLAGFGIFAATPTGLALLNSYGFAMQKTDDATFRRILQWNCSIWSKRAHF